MLASAVSVGFEDDQWTFFQPPQQELRVGAWRDLDLEEPIRVVELGDEPRIGEHRADAVAGVPT